MSHLLLYPDLTITLPLRYYGSVSYYAAMAAYGRCEIAVDDIFDKRLKEVHRCEVADTHGRVQLTVPISKPHGILRAKWGDIKLSSHGMWWHVHRVTLESAYGRTPFFEFYIDRFLPFLNQGVMESYPTIASLDLAIDAVIREILLIETDVTTSLGGEFSAVKLMPQLPYYQVREGRHGFIPDLSVLDLIFNLGPEAPLYLKRVLDSCHF